MKPPDDVGEQLELDLGWCTMCAQFDDDGCPAGCICMTLWLDGE